MTGLGRDDFGQFFGAVNGGHRPFSWQLELLDHLCDTGRWPHVLSAPTGAGKSSAVDVHIFASALSALGRAPRIPRRLAVVVNRRGLVDSHAQHADALRAALASEGGVVGAVAAALAPLSLRGEPLGLVSLRGGMAPDSSWLDDPGACYVISATPDMWGSRLLFRGYGSTRYAWPREAGLLGFDSVLLLDESHLNRQLHQTASDVARIIHRGEARVGVPGLQVTTMTATPPPLDAETVVIGVDAVRLDDPRDDPLRVRLTRTKTVEYQAVPSWPTRAGPASDAYIDALAQAARDVRAGVHPAEAVSGTVGCFVNRVDTAIRLAQLLAHDVGEHGVACWVGRMRPMDLDELRDRNPGLFTVRGDDTVTYLVATQTVEVGVDIDLAGLVTELADGSALTQRFGRVNRLGRRDTSRVRVIGPVEIAGDTPPYLEADLAAARAWVHGREQAGGVAPVQISADPAPVPDISRLALSDLSSGHARVLAHTSSNLFAEPDLAFWLRDDLEPDTEPVSFVVRADLPDDDSSAIAMLEAAAPTAAEAFPVRIGVARQLLSTILGSEPGTGEPPARCFRWRDRAVQQLVDELTTRPGDVLIVDEGHRLTRRRVVVADAETVERFPLGKGEGVIDVVIRGRTRAHDDLLDALSDAAAEDVQETFEQYQDLLELPTPIAAQVVIPVPDQGSGTLPWAVLLAPDSLPGDAEIRQEWTTHRAAVGLEAHQQAVADQARTIAERIGLATDIANTLISAGLHHDDGKADTRFQRDVLGAPPGVLLAKSAGNAQQVRRRRMGSGLPPGWRHEQLSAALVWARADQSVDAHLVTRLVGTSHGRGRPFFPHGARPADGNQPGGRLLSGSDPDVWPAAFDLFETGAGWDDVLVGTSDCLSEWGCAYLEALLRAADCTVSKAGS